MFKIETTYTSLYQCNYMGVNSFSMWRPLYRQSLHRVVVLFNTHTTGYIEKERLLVRNLGLKIGSHDYEIEKELNKCIFVKKALCFP